MRVIKTYIADDGKRFDSEYECMEYEEKLRSNKFADSAFLFDQDGKKLPLTGDGFEQAYFIICKTEEAADYLYEESLAGCGKVHGAGTVTLLEVLGFISMENGLTRMSF